MPASPSNWALALHGLGLALFWCGCFLLWENWFYGGDVSHWASPRGGNCELLRHWPCCYARVAVGKENGSCGYGIPAGRIWPAVCWACGPIWRGRVRNVRRCRDSIVPLCGYDRFLSVPPSRHASLHYRSVYRVSRYRRCGNLGCARCFGSSGFPSLDGRQLAAFLHLPKLP